MSEVDIERKESGGVPWWAWLLGALLLAALIWYATAAMSAKPGAEVAVGADNGAMVADTDVNATGAMDADVNAAPAMDADVNATGAMDADVNATGAMDADVNAAPAMDADTNMAPAMGADADKSMSNSAADVGTVATGGTAAITNILSVVDAKDPAALYNKKVKLVGAPVQAAGTEVFWVGPSFEQKMLVVTDGSTNMNGINTGVAQRDRVDLEGTIMEITDFDDAKTKYKLDDNAITFLTNKKILLMATSVKRDQN